MRSMALGIKERNSDNRTLRLPWRLDTMAIRRLPYDRKVEVTSNSFLSTNREEASRYYFKRYELALSVHRSNTSTQKFTMNIEHEGIFIRWFIITTKNKKSFLNFDDGVVETCWQRRCWNGSPGREGAQNTRSHLGEGILLTWTSGQVRSLFISAHLRVRSGQVRRQNRVRFRST